MPVSDSATRLVMSSVRVTRSKVSEAPQKAEAKKGAKSVAKGEQEFIFQAIQSHLDVCSAVKQETIAR